LLESEKSKGQEGESLTQKQPTIGWKKQCIIKKSEWEGKGGNGKQGYLEKNVFHIWEKKEKNIEREKGRVKKKCLIRGRGEKRNNAVESGVEQKGTIFIIW